MFEPTPTHIYLEITHKIRAEHTFGPEELFQDFTRLYVALQETLRTIRDLEDQNTRAYRAITDQDAAILSLQLDVLALQEALKDKK